MLRHYSLLHVPLLEYEGTYSLGNTSGQSSHVLNSLVLNLDMSICNYLVKTGPAAQNGVTCLLCKQQLNSWSKTMLVTGRFYRYCWRTHGQTAASGELQKTQQQKGSLQKSLNSTACIVLHHLELKCHHICEHSGAMPSCHDQAGYALLQASRQMGIPCSTAA